MEQRSERRRKHLLERRLVRLREQLAVQRGIQVVVQLEIHVTIQLTTHVPMQVATQLTTLLPVLPDVHRSLHRETKPRLRHGPLAQEPEQDSEVTLLHGSGWLGVLSVGGSISRSYGVAAVVLVPPADLTESACGL